MFRSGLDWSGDGGDPSRSGSSARLVVVVATIADDARSVFDEALQRVRRARRLPENYCFKFSGSRPGIREAFFVELARQSASFQATVVDKSTWSEDYLRTTTGQTRVIEAIVETIATCADTFVAGQTLLIDSDRDEQRAVNQIRGRLRRALADADRRSFARVKAYPDHGGEGAIIQIADMVAGALQDAGEIRGPYLSLIASRLLVNRR